ncbi:mechanosensitive ion channel family protein [Bosea sp. Leaf344]|uniref:mechanosensitive ion channel family protein n=1 Tax=Bosea sp. Leaf344 TaxID=1736346 RepID=UPI000A8AC94F|nr:mechanosensitive ion channel family protein [Bosea sp. Leaf344]
MAEAIGRRLAIVLLVAAAWLAAPAPPALAQADQPVVLTLQGSETAEQIRQAVDAITATGRRVEIRMGAKASPVQAEPVSKLGVFWRDFEAGLDSGNAAIPQVTRLPGDVAERWLAARNPQPGLRLLAIILAAAGAAWAFRRATGGWFARRLVPAGPDFLPRLRISLLAALQDGLTAIIVIGALALGRNALLPQPDIAAATAASLGAASVMVALHLVAARFLLSPGRPERRLVPIERAERHYAWLLAYVGLGGFAILLARLALDVARDPATVMGVVALGGYAVLVLKLCWFFDARRDLRQLVLRSAREPGPGPALRLLAWAAPFIFMASAVAIWMVGRASFVMVDGQRWGAAAGLTQFIIILTPVVAIGATTLLRAWQAREQARTDVPATPVAVAVGAMIQAGMGGLVWIGAAFWLSQIWAALFVDTATADYAAFRKHAFAQAMLLFSGWVALVFLRAFFGAFSPRPTSTLPFDEETQHDEAVPSRLATVLPVVRGIVLSGVIVLTALVALSQLGVDIGPLLAGFGILGLAISFGSQALVRDIVSGFFFMVEDAFRVGEYVDTGRLKGTVEKISLRSVQLRHQSGQIHTIPFGQIPSLTNASRDWATVKFNVRLDRSVDLEKARKAIKKVGLALLEDPEYGPHFIAPLKMQGVADIADTALVIRLKFTAKPNQASGLQREALKRVYRALGEAGIDFASNQVTVRGGEGGAAHAGAALSVVPPPTPLAPTG